MPNFEIHGFYADEDLLQILPLKMFIDKTMEELGLTDDAITTVVKSSAKSCSDKKNSTPFIRIYSTNLAEIERIVDAFKKKRIGKHGVDIETLVLSRFVLAKEMK